MRKIDAVLLFEDDDYRIVKSDSYYVEKKNGTDALGVARWSSVGEIPVDEPYREVISIDVPSKLFRALMRSLRSVKSHEETIARLRGELDAAEAKLRRYEGGSAAGMLDRS